MEDVSTNTRQLYRACDAAIDSHAPTVDYYELHPHREDGGYLDAHIETCREAFSSLPSYPSVAEAACRCTVRISESQSLNHISQFGSDEATRRLWEGAGVTGNSGLEWWEIAAAAVTSLPVLALIGAAGGPALSADDAARVEAAYFPWAASLHTLLDSLVDHQEDEASGHISQVDLYPTADVAAERLGIIASRSLELAAELPQGALHSLILTGMIGYYLASSEEWDDDREQISRSVLKSLSRFSRPVLAIHRLRQGRPIAAMRATCR